MLPKVGSFRTAHAPIGADLLLRLDPPCGLEAGAFLDYLKSAGKGRMTGGGASRRGRVDLPEGVADHGEI